MPLIAAACFILTVALGYWIFTATPEPPPYSPLEVRRQALAERKKAVYENLKDLHFEHLAGKLSAADFDRTRAMLEAEAAAVIAELQAVEWQLHPPATAPPPAQPAPPAQPQ
ncbi:MAG TPA: hypothetical protein VFP94_10970 [Terriglobales bacterium]|nr:hypothetical protein [Terriglobales bacterium]